MEWSQLPELVKDTQLQTRFKPNYTIHEFVGGPHPSVPIRQEVWKRIRTIGQGGFSYVCLEECLSRQEEGTPQTRAVKVIRLTRESNIKSFSRELEATAKFSQKKFRTYFVQSFGWFRSPDELFISLEYFSLGDLQSYISNKGCISEDGSRHITWQILQGLNIMHDEGFAHRDLKPANILVKACPPSSWWVKLGDFGLSKRTGMTQLPSLAGGTPGFIAPDILEVLYRDGNTEPSVTIPHTKWVAGDLWSLGEVVVRIMSGKATFRSHEHMMQYSLQLKPFPNSELVDRGLSLDAVDFVQKAMTSKALDRMTSKKGLLHDWIKLSIDPKSISILGSRSASNHTFPSVVYRDWSVSEPTQPIVYESASETTNSLPAIISSAEMDHDSVTTQLQPHDYLDQQPPLNLNSAGDTLDLSAASRSITKLENSTQSSAKGIKNALLNKSPVGLGPVFSQVSKITNDPILGIKFSSDSEMLFASTKESVLSWDCSSQQVQRLQRDGSHKITHFSVSPDGRRAALVTDNCDIQVADLKIGRVFNTVTKYQWELTCVAFSHDSNTIACGFNDGSVSIIDARSGELIKKLGQKSLSRGKRKPIVWVAFTDAENVISICQSGRLYVWAFTKYYDLFQIKPGENKIVVASSCYSKVIAIATSEDIRIWVHDGQPAKGRYTCIGTIPPSHSGPIRLMDFSADGGRLLICRAAGQCEIWHIMESPVLSVTFSLSGQPRFSIAISPDDMQVAFGTERGSIQTTDITEAILVACLRGHSSKAMFISISDDGTKVASVCKRSAVRKYSDDGQIVVIWDLNTESVAQVLRVGGKGIYDAVFSRDSQRLAVIFDNGVTTIWEVSTGDLVASIGKPLLKGGILISAAVSPDLTRVAIVDRDGFELQEKVRVHTASGPCMSPEELSLGNGSFNAPDAVCFLNDGTRIVVSYPHGSDIYETCKTTLNLRSDIRSLSYDCSLDPYVSWDIIASDQKSSGALKSFLMFLVREEGTVQKPGESYARIPRLVASADSGIIAHFHASGNVCFYSLGDKSLINESWVSKDTRLTGTVACISPNWQFLAVISPEHGVNIWDVSMRKAISFLGTNKAKAKTVMISSDSKDLFILTEKELFVYDTVYLQVPTTVLPLRVPVRSLQVSSLLGRVILALSNNTIEIWDYRKACITQTFYGYV